MRIPRWVPQVPRPWNPAFGDTWDVMTPDERRWSFVIDVAVIITFLFVIGVIF